MEEQNFYVDEGTGEVLEQAPWDEPAEESQQDYFESKQAERQELGERADAMIEKAFESPGELESFLEKRHQIGMSPINTLLIMDQYPEATMVKTYDEWMQKDLPEEKRHYLRSVKRGMKGLKVFQKAGEYTKADGSTGINYKVIHVFDISQTYGAKLPEVEVEQPLPNKLFKAFSTKTKVPMRISSDVDAQTMAVSKDGAVFLTRNVTDGKAFFARAVEEYMKAIYGSGDSEQSKFVARCTAVLICKRFGIRLDAPDYIPPSISNRDISEKRELLNDIHRFAKSNIGRINDNLDRQAKTQYQSR